MDSGSWEPRWMSPAVSPTIIASTNRRFLRSEHRHRPMPRSERRAQRRDQPRPPEARENKHAGTSGDIRIHEESDLPALLEGHPNPLVLILDCVQDPHNLGACLRTADAA